MENVHRANATIGLLMSTSLLLALECREEEGEMHAAIRRRGKRKNSLSIPPANEQERARGPGTIYHESFIESHFPRDINKATKNKGFQEKASSEEGLQVSSTNRLEQLELSHQQRR